MEPQLKQRLIGVTIAVALVVIFLPMLFDKSDDKGNISSAGIPPIPEDVLEKPLDLPKTAEDLVEKEQEETKKSAPPESGYKIVPLDDEALPNPNASNPAALKVSKDGKGGETIGTLNGGEEDNPEAATPAENTGQATRSNETAPPVLDQTPKSALPPVKHMIEPGQFPASKQAVTPSSRPSANAGPRVEPVPGPTKAGTLSAKPKPAVRPAATVTGKPDAIKKPETVKSTESQRPAIKTVKVNKPKVTAPVREPDDEGEPVPVPAKAETQSTKPKLSAAPSARPAAATLKKPESSPATPVRPPKPTVVKAKKPTAWVIQAGSFTDEAAAKGLAEKLKQSKFPASVQAVHGEHGSVYKVQVGAEHDRGRAEETLKQIEGSTGINGIITPRR